MLPAAGRSSRGPDGPSETAPLLIDIGDAI
jgi:hypothetical protein